jgi:antitoxin (DNA-binding transcriptional repressor) of toxin-antitoxin stability system
MDRVAAGEEVIITRRGRPRFRMLPVNAGDSLGLLDAVVARSPEWQVNPTARSV